MKKLLIILCAVFMLAACSAPKDAENVQDEERPAMGGVTIANPFTNYETLEEAFEGAGLSMNLPETVADHEITEYRAMPGKLLEIIYGEVNDMIKVRKSAGVEDNSGNYSADVLEASTIEHEGLTINIECADGLVRVAYWSVNNESFSMTSDTGIEQAELIALVNTINF